MTHDHWGIVSGVVALALGIFATLHLVPVEEPEQEPPIATELSALATTAPSATPDLPGVPASIDRVLQQNGDARLAAGEELAQLPPTVAAVLVEYGVTLRLASPRDTGQ